MSHFLLSYELAADYLERRGTLRNEHLALAWEAADRGALMPGGAVGDPPSSALLLFDDRAEAEQFARADPYVREGIVTQWSVNPWVTVVGAAASAPLRPRE